MKIFVVDDHKIIRDGIKAMLLGHPVFSFCGAAAHAQECLSLISEAKPDICLLDVQLPGKSGVELAEELLSLYPTLRIIIATALLEESIVRKCRTLGIKGMVSKENGLETYLEALEAVRNGKTYYSGQFTDLLIQTTHQKSDKLSLLTQREIEMVKYLANGYTYKQLSDTLNISPRTIEVHKKNIMDKLAIESIPDLVKFAIKEGLIHI